METLLYILVYWCIVGMISINVFMFADESIIQWTVNHPILSLFIFGPAVWMIAFTTFLFMLPCILKFLWSHKEELKELMKK